MDFQLNEDESALVSAVQAILDDHQVLPQAARLDFCYFDHDLQNALRSGGFIDAGRMMGPVAAALVVLETARIPATLEIAASALVLPHIFPDEQIEGPLALVAGDSLMKAQRNLAVAKAVLIDLGDDVALLRLAPGDVEPVDSILGYPYGRLAVMPDLARCVRRGAGPLLRQWWRVALAAEAAGAAQAAIAFTIDYVTERHAFGRPIGSFQAVQHRLAQCHQIAMGIRYLVLRAAWSGKSIDADQAACYAQQHVRKLMFDLHQFNGAMGVTNEHLLHFWTYRLRALQAEAGGVYGTALAIADQLWGPAESTVAVACPPRPAPAFGTHITN
jgi:hypothetical protein